MSTAPGLLSLKSQYSHFVKGHEAYLHLCAHSHHYWPDVSRAAQLQAWDDAALLSDRKWEKIIGEVLPAVQKGVAQHLSLSRPERLTFGTNTHELFLRLLSCFDSGPRPLKILSTDSEFHSFRRQTARLGESGDVDIKSIPQFPRETFAERFLTAARAETFDMIFLSHVFFNSGGVIPNEAELLSALKNLTPMLVVDTYHSFLSRPVDFKYLEDDIYLLGGGYKYAQAGEGLCFLYTPPKADALRPKNTGWYAHFASLAAPPSSQVEYGTGAWRFWGSTFDPTALYRGQAMINFLHTQKLDAQKIHTHALALQEASLKIITEAAARNPWLASLHKSLPKILPITDRGNFLSFPLPPADAQALGRELAQRKILFDQRESAQVSYLRWGFGLYHDAGDLEELQERLR